MRDGTRLAIDLYRPTGSERVPVILMRTPYNKNVFRRAGSVAWRFAANGFAVAVQDVRGMHESEGEFIPQNGDVTDGYDTVEWIASQPWSNGKVGTYGCSYLGDVQILMATARPPHLAAMIPQSAGSSVGRGGGRYSYFGITHGGAIDLGASFGWFWSAGSKGSNQLPPGMTREDWIQARIDGRLPAVGARKVGVEPRDWWGRLPLMTLVEASGGPPNDFRSLVSRPLSDPWWDQFGYLTGAERFDVPALHINGWYDFGVAETLYQFNLLRQNSVSSSGRDHQFAVISPTVHCAAEQASARTIVGARDVGDARRGHEELYLRWFDRWLKGVDNGIDREPPLHIYVMGKNQWRAEREWPLARTEWRKYYLHSRGRANSRWGDGTLSTTRPGQEPPDRYEYDPRTPVPSRGGPLCCTGSADAPEGSFDQSDVEARHDVLVYTTAPLERGLEVTGPIKAVLYVSSDARDTDFTVKLVDVHPDGSAYNIQEGILRARYRMGFDTTAFLSPGRTHRVDIDMQATSNWFGPGHRIRLEVSSSNFPRFDRNLNTGGNNFDESTWRIARNAVHHDSRAASHLVLPTIP
ncbi:MAG: CocE/NonD family hydrolase [Gemmatimonadales bacterium]|nr:CocE/NonD family hydrolase [Gemmatimonadales bacterium]